MSRKRPPLRDRALILKRRPYGESSLVVHVLTRDHGRAAFLAKGAYRSTSRFFCVLDWFDTVELEWRPGREAELGNLAAGDIRTRRPSVAGCLPVYRRALIALELCEIAAQPGIPDPGLFEALARCLDQLQAAAAARAPHDALPSLVAPVSGSPAAPEPPDLALIEFEAAFLAGLGLAPSLAGCAACGGPAPAIRGATARSHARVAFSAGAGGRLCTGCAEEARASGRRVGTMPLPVVECAHRLFERGSNLDLPREEPDLVLRVRDLLERFLDYHLETRPRSQRQFLAAPNRNAP